MPTHRTLSPCTTVPFLLAALLGPNVASAQTGTTDTLHPPRPLVSLSVGLYVGGFPLLFEGGLRGGIGFFGERLIVGADYGFLVLLTGVSDRALRAQLAPIPSEGVIGRLYLHGYRRWVGKGAGYGGGIGYRTAGHGWPRTYAFIELSIAMLTTNILGDSPGSYLVPSLLRGGFALSF